MIISEKIKILRKKTSISFKKCIIALNKNNHDINKSILWLRKNNIDYDIKKQNSNNCNVGIILSSNFSLKNFFVFIIRSETNFVIQNPNFIDFTKKLLSVINLYNINNLHEFINSTKYQCTSIKTLIKQYINLFGENINIYKLYKFYISKYTYFTYQHNKINDNLSKILSIVFFFKTSQS